MYTQLCLRSSFKYRQRSEDDVVHHHPIQLPGSKMKTTKTKKKQGQSPSATPVYDHWASLPDSGKQ